VPTVPWIQKNIKKIRMRILKIYIIYIYIYINIYIYISIEKSVQIENVKNLKFEKMFMFCSSAASWPPRRVPTVPWIQKNIKEIRMRILKIYNIYIYIYI